MQIGVDIGIDYSTINAKASDLDISLMTESENEIITEDNDSLTI